MIQTFFIGHMIEKKALLFHVLASLVATALVLPLLREHCNVFDCLNDK